MGVQRSKCSGRPMIAYSMGSSPHLVIPLHRRLNRQVSIRARRQNSPDQTHRTRPAMYTMYTSRFGAFGPPNCHKPSEVPEPPMASRLALSPR
jgi:hypothetical protein